MSKRASSDVHRGVPQSGECAGALLFGFCDPDVTKVMTVAERNMTQERGLVEQ
jgi:hypothetical protein